MIVRSAFAQLGYSAAMLVLTVFGLALTYLVPPLLLLSTEPARVLGGAAAWLCMSIAFLPTLLAYNVSPLVVFLLPLIALFCIAATVA